jgi:hypothetical protein
LEGDGEMSSLLIVAAIAISAYAGFTQLSWYMILVSGFVFTVGYFLSRTGMIHSQVTSEGWGAIPKLVLYSFVWNSILMAVVFGGFYGIRLLVN